MTMSMEDMTTVMKTLQEQLNDLSDRLPAKDVEMGDTHTTMNKTDEELKTT